MKYSIKFGIFIFFTFIIFVGVLFVIGKYIIYDAYQNNFINRIESIGKVFIIEAKRNFIEKNYKNLKINIRNLVDNEPSISKLILVLKDIEIEYPKNVYTNIEKDKIISLPIIFAKNSFTDIKNFIGKTTGNIKIIPNYSLLYSDFKKAFIYFFISGIVFAIFFAFIIWVRIKKEIEIYLEYFVNFFEKKIQNNMDENIFLGEFKNIYNKILKILNRFKKVENELIEKQKMQAIITLTSGIAHEINNKLTPILGYSDVLLKNKNFSENEKDRYLKSIKNSALRARDIIKTMIDLKSGITILENKSCELISTIKNVIKIFNYDYRSQGKKEPINLKILTNSELFVGIAPNHLQQIMYNIIENSFEAYSKKQEKSVDVIIKEDNQYIFLEIIDYGCGIDEDNIDKVFEPFFTTKKPDKVGLGLSIVYSLIKGYKGSIEITSRKNEKTRVLVKLPKLLNSKLKSEMDSKELYLNKKIIAIFSKNEDVIETIIKLLNDSGYEIHVEKSLKKLKNNIKMRKYDLIICDSEIGELTGLDVYFIIKEMFPYYQNHFLLLGNMDDYADIIKNEKIVMLKKPFDGDELKYSLFKLFSEF